MNNRTCAIVGDAVKFFSGPEFYKKRTFKKEEELILAQFMILGDNSARDKLFFDNYWIVNSIASKFSDKTIGIELEEMQSAGCIALLEGLSNFDPNRNVRISTYLYPKIFLAIWNLVVEYRCGITVPKYLYKSVASHSKGEDGLSDIDFCKKYNISLTEFNQITYITKVGIPVISSFEEYVGGSYSTGGQDDFSANDILGENTNVTHNNNTVPEEVRIELKMFGEQLEQFAQRNLTKQQNKVLIITIIPYLKGEQYMSLAEAANHLNRSFQAVDQIFTWIRIKLVDTNAGRKYLKIIEETLKFIRQQRRKK